MPLCSTAGSSAQPTRILHLSVPVTRDPARRRAEPRPCTLGSGAKAAVLASSRALVASFRNRARRPILPDALATKLDREEDRADGLARRLTAVRSGMHKHAAKQRRELSHVSKKTWIGMALLAAGTAAAIVEDFASDVWADRPMVATLSGGVLVLGWTVVLVNQYLAARERRRWLMVAAAALEDLGQAARGAWRQLVFNLPLIPFTEFQGRDPSLALWRRRLMNAQAARR